MSKENSIIGIMLGKSKIETSMTGDGNPIQKQKMMIDCTLRDRYTGEPSKFVNKPVLEFAGEKIVELNKCNKGDVVEVFFDVIGREYTERGTNIRKTFTIIRPYRIEVRRAAEASNTQPVQPVQTVVTPQQNEDDLPF